MDALCPYDVYIMSHLICRVLLVMHCIKTSFLKYGFRKNRCFYLFIGEKNLPIHLEFVWVRFYQNKMLSALLRLNLILNLATNIYL